MASCGTCKFFQKETGMLDQSTYRNGFCRRFPPVPSFGFPNVLHNNWCGEYQMNQEELSRQYKEFSKNFPEVRP